MVDQFSDGVQIYHCQFVTFHGTIHETVNNSHLKSLGYETQPQKQRTTSYPKIRFTEIATSVLSKKKKKKIENIVDFSKPHHEAYTSHMVNQQAIRNFSIQQKRKENTRTNPLTFGSKCQPRMEFRINGIETRGV